MDKVSWKLQVDEDGALHLDQVWLKEEANALRVQNELQEADMLRKEELKKNKSKYLPILDRDVPPSLGS